MKSNNEFQLMIPHLLILEDEEYISNINPEDLQAILNDAAEETYQKEPETHGLYSLEDSENAEDGPIAVCWYTNIYNVIPTIKFGLPVEGDIEEIQKKTISHLMTASLNLSLTDNDENLAIFDTGILKVKLDSTENKRIYEVRYEIIDSNSEEAMKDATNMLDELEQQANEADPDLSSKRVLH